MNVRLDRVRQCADVDSGEGVVADVDVLGSSWRLHRKGRAVRSCRVQPGQGCRASALGSRSARLQRLHGMRSPGEANLR